MVGAIRLAYCVCGITPPIIPPPSFPGTGKVTFYGNAQSNGQAPLLYTTGEGYTPCYSTPLIAYSVFPAIKINLSSNMAEDATLLLGESQIGNYSTGVVRKQYDRSGITFENLDYVNLVSSEITCIPASEYGPTEYPCGTPVESICLQTLNYTDSKQSDGSAGFNYVAFGWLGVAQRDLPGIRVQRISGSKKWLVSVNAGLVRIYAEDGSESFSTSGTLEQVAAAINASSIGSKISARCSGWSTYVGESETGGNVISGRNEWDYMYTKNDPSTMLKNLGPIYIQATFCNDSLAPSGWGNSTRLPVYFRGETLPPRGVVYLGLGDFYNPTYFINSKTTLYPQLKNYENTEAGALAFVTEPIYPKTQTVHWGNWTLGFPSGPEFDYGAGWSSVLSQLDFINNQSRINPGVSQFQQNIAPLWYFPQAGETITVSFGNYELLGTCYGDPGGQYCPDPPVCVPGQICDYGPYFCSSTGCYFVGGFLPCGFEPEPCTQYYEYINPANNTVLSYTYPSSLIFTTSTSFHVQIS